ncbi:hypothetical protein MW651_000710 [Vibrio vulnificus]|nr:hypothetical protein [Vibrio vulnificus]
MKRCFSMGLLALACQAQAVELEVSLLYSEGYTQDSGVLVSSEIVGFYRSLDAANELFQQHNVDLTFVPAKITAVAESQFDASMNVSQTRAALDRGALESLSDHAGHFVMGLAHRANSDGTVGYALSFSHSKYAMFDRDLSYKLSKKAAISSNILNDAINPRNRYVLVHELLHGIGAAHDETGALRFDTFSSGYTFGHGEDCGDGNRSLMAASFMSYQGVLMLSGADNCNQGNGDMVRFIRQFAPRVASHENYFHMNTLAMTVFEDVAESEFEFTVTRSKDVSLPSVAYIHVSGSNASVTNELAPVTVVFDANESVKTVAVPFANVHPLFDDAELADKKVFAVAVSEVEVMPNLVELSAINTQWKPSMDNGNGGDNGNSGDNSHGSTGGSSGGGSLGLLILLLFSVGFVRYRN